MNSVTAVVEEVFDVRGLTRVCSGGLECKAIAILAFTMYQKFTRINL